MATELADHCFEILPYADADSGVAFGAGLELSVDQEGFKPGGIEWFTEDQQNPINGATAFGRDQLLGPTWAWDIFVNATSQRTARAALARLTSAWKAKQVRAEIGAVTAVRYELDGVTRRIYGRPRRLEATINNGILDGYVPISTDFKCADANTYDDVESSIQMELLTEGKGGFVFPTTFPLQTLPYGTRGDQAVVGGDADTYPVIRFEGPITNPSIECEEWGLTLNVTLNDGDVAVVDTRPWANTVLLNGDTSVADALGPRQWLSRMALSPGTHDFSFSGSTSGSGATCRVAWRNAYDSI